MFDPRILGAILLLGAAAVAAKLIELWRWHIDGDPLDGPPSVRVTTRVNGSAIDEAQRLN